MLHPSSQPDVHRAFIQQDMSLGAHQRSREHTQIRTASEILYSPDICRVSGREKRVISLLCFLILRHLTLRYCGLDKEVDGLL